MSELKSCPFCESKAEHYSFNYRKHTVRCTYCLADCGEHDTPERAAFVWNSRPNEFVKDKEIEQLTAEVERLKGDNQVYRDMLNSLLNEEVYHLDNATMTNIKYELDNRGTDTNVPTNADKGSMEG
jgi:hypothetical protein